MERFFVKIDNLVDRYDICEFISLNSGNYKVFKDNIEFSSYCVVYPGSVRFEKSLSPHEDRHYFNCSENVELFKNKISNNENKRFENW